MDIYSEIIIDYYKKGAAVKKLTCDDIVQEAHNTLCGDSLTLGVKIESNKIIDVSAITKGCAISTASSWILCKETKGKSVEEAKEILQEFLDGLTKDGIISNERLKILEGVKKYPSRVKCATMVWHILKEVLNSHDARNNP